MNEEAEMLGYYTFRCPNCGRRGATDTTPACDYCGAVYGEDTEEDEDANGASRE